MKRLLFFPLLALLVVGCAPKASVELPPLFTDNMVFQQNTSAPVWGTTAPKAKVTVCPSWDGKNYTTIAGPDGKWSVNIDTPEGNYDSYTMTISAGKDPVTIKDVLVGEVWLCSGQSNMEMPV